MEVPNIKFHENPSSGSRADKCAQWDGRTKNYEKNIRCSRECDRACQLEHQFKTYSLVIHDTKRLVWKTKGGYSYHWRYVRQMAVIPENNVDMEQSSGR